VGGRGLEPPTSSV